MKRIPSHFVIATAIVIAVSGMAWAESVNESCPANSDGVVSIDNLAGMVEIIGWSADEVEVTGTLGRGTERLEFDCSGERTRIRVVLRDNVRNTKGSHLRIQVPATSRVEATTVSADITASDLDGELELESVSGEITLTKCRGEIEAQSVSGSLEIDNAPVGSDLVSVSGDISVRNAGGELEAATVSGTITVEGQIEGGELATTSGSIRCEADLVADLDMESMSGDLTLIVPAGIAASFDISTHSGEINNQLGPEPSQRNKHGFGSGQELSFSTGSGPNVSITTFSGDVRLLTN